MKQTIKCRGKNKNRGCENSQRKQEIYHKILFPEAEIEEEIPEELMRTTRKFIRAITKPIQHTEEVVTGWIEEFRNKKSKKQQKHFNKSLELLQAKWSKK